MTIQVNILFDEPQHAIEGLLRESYLACRTAWIVTGFATVEGVERLASAIVTQPSKLRSLVIGRGDYRGFEALDRMILKGVEQARLYVHLGFTRFSTSGAKNPFYRYRPMLHSKVYLFEMDNGTYRAFIGSHNTTGFALHGLNGEAAVLIEGPIQDPEMQKIKRHIDACVSQSSTYSPTMKDAYTWWTESYLDGVRAKVKAPPGDDEWKKTIVILAT